MIRTRLQGDTPFFPNMLNNGNVEVCLKEDVDAAIAELKQKLHDTEIQLRVTREDCILYKEQIERKEADKVIAELKDKLDLYKRGWEENDKVNENLYAQLRHNKYRRCLAMAKWCRMHDEFTQLESERLGLQQRTLFFEYRKKAMWWNKWCKRWLELAKKFKEAK